MCHDMEVVEVQKRHLKGPFGKLEACPANRATHVEGCWGVKLPIEVL